MAITTETIVKPDGFTGYLARPERAGAPLPGVLVLQEAWGVDDHIEDVTRRIAAAGYVALAPDLFAEDGKRPEPLSRERLKELVAFANQVPAAFSDPAARDAALAERPADERARLDASLTALRAIGFAPERREVQLAVIGAAARYLREEQPETRGQKLAAVGFCMGGTLAALLACRDPALAASVIFYGGAPTAEEVRGITCPVLGFYGEKDTRLMGQLPGFVEAMRAAGKRFESHVYPEAGHAFFNDGRPVYHVGASRDAWARLMIFLRDALA